MFSLLCFLLNTILIWFFGWFDFNTSVNLRKAIWWAWSPSSPAADRFRFFLVKEHRLQKCRLHLFCPSQLQEKQHINQNSQLTLLPYRLKRYYGPDSLFSLLHFHLPASSWSQWLAAMLNPAPAQPPSPACALSRHTCRALRAPKGGTQPFIKTHATTAISACWQCSAALEQDCLRVEE